MKFQRQLPLNLCIKGSAIHWNLWEDYTNKPEVEKSKMAASKLRMHVSLLPDKLSTKFQRLYLCLRGLASQWDSRDYNATIPELENPRWQPINIECMYLRLHTRYQRNSNCYTHSFWVQLSDWTRARTGSRKDGTFWTSNNHMYRLASLSKL